MAQGVLNDFYWGSLVSSWEPLVFSLVFFVSSCTLFGLYHESCPPALLFALALVVSSDCLCISQQRHGASLDSLVLSLASIEITCQLFGFSSEPLRCVSSSLLGLSDALFGLYWGSFVSSLGSLGGLLCPLWTLLGPLVPSLDSLGLSWDRLGLSLGALVLSLGSLGRSLGTSLHSMGISSTVLELLWTLLWSLWTLLDASWYLLGRSCPPFWFPLFVCDNQRKAQHAHRERFAF